MSFGSACALLITATLRNLAAQTARRMRKARYLVPGLFSVLYFGWVLHSQSQADFKRVFPWMFGLAGRAESIGALLFFGLAAAFWLLGKPEPRLVFSEAEIQFLFAAPATRRQVVHYRLVKLLLQTVPGAGIFAIFAASAFPGSRLAVAVGLWLGMATLALHQVGASFARARIHGLVSGLRLRAVQVAALGLLAAALFGMVAGPSLASGPWSWMLWPARALVRPLLAEGAGPFLWALLFAAAVFAMHYWWVLLSAERFEDVAVRRAEQVARQMEALRGGGLTAVVSSGKRRPVPFRLGPSGRPEIALAWKGLVAFGRSAMLRVFIVVSSATLAGLIALAYFTPSMELARSGAPEPAMQIGQALGLGAGVFLVMTGLLGPALTGGGVAGDLSRLEFLRTLPLSGARIVMGLTLSPALLLAAAWSLLAPTASLLFPFHLGGFERGCLAVALMAIGPPLLYMGVLMQALLTLLLPGWTRTTPGLPSFGTTMLTSVVQMIGLPIAALPAAATALVVGFASFGFAGWAALPLAAVLAAAVLVAQLALALGLAGRMFEKLDPSDL